MQLISSRRVVTLAGAALATATLPLAAAITSASAADPVSVTKDLTYNCDFTIPNDPTPNDPNPNPLVLADLPTGVKVAFTAPSLQAGGTIAPTDIDITLSLFDGLAGASRDIYNAYAADGASTNTVLTATSAEGQSQNYTIPHLSSAKADLPAGDELWQIAASGQSPEIAIPDTSSLTLSAPATFDIAATLYTRDPDTQAEGTKPVAIACEVDAAASPSLEVATLAVEPAPEPTPDPTDDPTDDPTSEPTDPSTTDPTDGTDDGVSDGNGQINPVNDRTPAASSDALPNTGAPNGLAALGTLAAALLLGGAGLLGRRAVIARHRA